MTDPQKPGTPTRRNARVHHEVLVGVTSDQGRFSGWGTNLSVGGVFVNSNHAPPVGARVSVLLQLPGHGECKLNGRVAWAQSLAPGVDEPGMGIEFIEPDQATRELVGRMVEKLAQDLARAPA
ncbi:MAG TPA: TIGR02266 family protein [Myxococcales bacterium]|nr:TIGR02266 family protein [Myxococcales bacterium]